jgi:hypothetical protein
MTVQVRELDEYQLEELWQKISLYDSNGGDLLLQSVRTRRTQLQVLRAVITKYELKQTEMSGPYRNAAGSAYVRQCNHCGEEVLDHLCIPHLAVFHPYLTPDTVPPQPFSAKHWIELHDKLSREYSQTKLEYETREIVAMNARIVKHARFVVEKMGTSTVRSRFIEHGVCAWGCETVLEATWREHVVKNHLTDIGFEEGEVA